MRVCVRFMYTFQYIGLLLTYHSVDRQIKHTTIYLYSTHIDCVVSDGVWIELLSFFLNFGFGFVVAALFDPWPRLSGRWICERF